MKFQRDLCLHSGCDNMKKKLKNGLAIKHTFANVIRNFRERIEQVSQNNGGHLEHELKKV